jgi:hypothetical protein
MTDVPSNQRDIPDSPLDNIKTDSLVKTYPNYDGNPKDKKAWEANGYNRGAWVRAQRRAREAAAREATKDICGSAPPAGLLFTILEYFRDPTEARRRADQHWFERYLPPGEENSLYVPPVLLDLRGSGRIDTVNLNDGVYYDYDGDGFAEATGWVSPDAGILVMDRNGNGVLDNGSELFGSLTPLPDGQPAADGFEALAALDGNHDGKIDAQDGAYSQLMVWANSGGEENWQAGQLFSLPQLGITSIDLNWTTVNTTDAQGNIELYAGSFQWNDGTTGLIADYGFRIEPSNTIPLETLAVPGDIAALPDVPASGTVYNLQQAMVRDTSGRLKALVRQFAAENDPNMRTALVDQILFQWTGSENMDPNSRGGSIDSRKLAVLEAFTGEEWSSTVAYQGNSKIAA